MVRLRGKLASGAPTASLPHPPLPFESDDTADGSTLRLVLKRRFLKPAVSWMLGQRGQRLTIARLPPLLEVEVASCWWGVALYLECFVKANQEEDLFDVEERRVLAACSRHLVEVLLINQGTNQSWDNAVWDTAVIARSLLLFLDAARSHRLAIETESGMLTEVQRRVELAFGWVMDQALHWDAVRYPFGPEDLAMILAFATVAHRQGVARGHFSRQEGSLTQADYDLTTEVRTLHDFIQYLVDRLLLAQTVTSNGGGVALVNWGSSFSTAHVLRVLTEAIDLVDEARRDRCVSSIVGAVAQIEQDQNEGQWGLPNSTALILHSYITACEWIGKQEQFPDLAIHPNPEIVFKALRWLTDEKQRFADGSILHTFTHTTFFALMLENVTAMRDFAMLDYTIPQLYDFVIWDSQIRLTRERAERLALAERVAHMSRRLHYYQRMYNQLITALRLLIVGGFCAIFVDVALDLRWLSFEPLAVRDPQTLLAALGLLASIVSTFWLFSRRWLRVDKI